MRRSVYDASHLDHLVYEAYYLQLMRSPNQFFHLHLADSQLEWLEFWVVSRYLSPQLHVFLDEFDVYPKLHCLGYR